jgi:hypothetical protein
VKKVTGKVVSVDAAANIVIVKCRKGEDTLSVGDKTVIMVGGKTAAIADLTPDMKVAVKYKLEEGVKAASKIYEKTAVTPKAKDTAVPAAPAAPETPDVPAE